MDKKEMTRYLESQAEVYRKKANELRDMGDRLAKMMDEDQTPKMLGQPTMGMLRNIYVLFTARAQIYQSMLDSEDEIAEAYRQACQTNEELHNQCTAIAFNSMNVTDPCKLEQIMSNYEDAGIDMYLGNMIFGKILVDAKNPNEAVSLFEQELQTMYEQYANSCS